MHITNWKKGVDGITNSMDESEQILGGSEAWCTAVHGVAKWT